MAYLEELLPEFRKGAKIRATHWNKGMFFQYKDGDLVDQDENVRNGFPLDKALSFAWELIKEPEPDWDYIIKNKCLCWFFDSNEEVIGSAGILTEVKSREEYPFIKTFNGIKFAYLHCRPVRRDEVTFYEDREEE